MKVPEKFAVPRVPYSISQTGSWAGLADSGGLVLISGSGDDTHINENFNRLYRVIKDQREVIKVLLNQLREAGYDNT